MVQETPSGGIIDPDLPIVDEHYHLWLLPEAALVAMEAHDGGSAHAIASVFRRYACYLLDETRRSNP
jgi:hypothetical protein